MSLCLNLKDIQPHKRFIREKCVVKPKETDYDKYPKPIYTFLVDKERKIVHLPMGVWNQLFTTFPKRMYDSIEVKFKFDLYTVQTDERKRDQDVVAAQAIATLTKQHTVLLALFTAFGKTATAIYIASKLKLKTLVVCLQKELRDQWKCEIEKFTSAKVCNIKANGVLDSDAEFYIVGIVQAVNMFKKNANVFDGIGTVIIDECHHIVADKFSKALQTVHPKYLIGLSATPDRKDGLDIMFPLYFGDSQSYIVREEKKSFQVIKLNTMFVPDCRTNMQGRLDWSNVINSLAYNPMRQRMIAKLAHTYPNEIIMILGQRVEELEGIAQYLEEMGENIDRFYGSKKKKAIKSDYRILLTGSKKGGEGFDDKRLTMLIIITDTTDIRQNEGRIRCDNNIVIDIVDKFGTLEKHWEMRKQWYLKRGATIITKRVVKTEFS